MKRDNRKIQTTDAAEDLRTLNRVFDIACSRADAATKIVELQLDVIAAQKKAIESGEAALNAMRDSRDGFRVAAEAALDGLRRFSSAEPAAPKPLHLKSVPGDGGGK